MMGGMATRRQKIVEYYQKSGWLYRYFWYTPRARGLHYGVWREGTKSHEQALLNSWRMVIEQGKIGRGMRVLDAGCGVGGGAVYIAGETGGNVWGVTVEPRQVEAARRYARSMGVAALTNFTCQDFTKTSFADRSFDVVFAVESVCHSRPKSAFLREAYRLLKVGGRLVILDGYCRRAAKDRAERELLRGFCRAWRLEELVETRSMTAAIRRAGYQSALQIELTDEVRPTLVRMRMLVGLARPLVWLSRYWSLDVLETIADNARAMSATIEGVRQGLMGYYAHVAVK